MFLPEYVTQDVVLPLGQDFQRFVKAFIDSSEEDTKAAYIKAKQLIDQLR